MSSYAHTSAEFSHPQHHAICIHTTKLFNSPLKFSSKRTIKAQLNPTPRPMPLQIWSKRDTSTTYSYSDTPSMPSSRMIRRGSHTSTPSNVSVSKRLPSALRKRQSYSKANGVIPSRASLDAFDVSFEELDWKLGSSSSSSKTSGINSSGSSSSDNQSQSWLPHQGVSFARDTKAGLNKNVYSIPQSLPDRLLNNGSNLRQESDQAVNVQSRPTTKPAKAQNRVIDQCFQKSNDRDDFMMNKSAASLPPLRVVHTTGKQSKSRQVKPHSQVVSDAQLVQVLLNMGYNEAQCQHAITALRQNTNANADDFSDGMGMTKAPLVKEETYPPYKLNSQLIPNTNDRSLGDKDVSKTMYKNAVASHGYAKDQGGKNDVSGRPSCSQIHKDSIDRLKTRIATIVTDSTTKTSSHEDKSKYNVPLSSSFDENDLNLTESKFASISADEDDEEIIEQTTSNFEPRSRVLNKDIDCGALDASIEVDLEMVPRRVHKNLAPKPAESDLFEVLAFITSCGLFNFCYPDSAIRCSSNKSDFVPPTEIDATLDDTNSIGELTQYTWEIDAERKSKSSNARQDSDSVTCEASYTEITIGDDTVKSILEAKETLRKYASNLEVKSLLNSDAEATIATLITRDTQGNTIDNDDFDYSIGSDTKASIERAKNTLKTHAHRVGKGIVENDEVLIRDIESDDESCHRENDDSMINYLLDSYEFCTGYDAPSRNEPREISIDDETLGSFVTKD